MTYCFDDGDLVSGDLLCSVICLIISVYLALRAQRASEGLPHTFGAPLHQISDLCPRTLEDRIAFHIGRRTSPTPMGLVLTKTFLQNCDSCVDVRSFSLLELLGAVTWTSPDLVHAPETERIWYVCDAVENASSLGLLVGV